MKSQITSKSDNSCYNEVKIKLKSDGKKKE